MYKDSNYTYKIFVIITTKTVYLSYIAKAHVYLMWCEDTEHKNSKIVNSNINLMISHCSVRKLVKYIVSINNETFATKFC